MAAIRTMNGSRCEDGQKIDETYFSARMPNKIIMKSRHENEPSSKKSEWKRIGDLMINFKSGQKIPVRKFNQK